ncbi:MAG: hypothetical protein GF344_13930 [Chitinivibrionales bacterium]|nr:hypothetical protein [Chitinivibrionales bacterium]MBD3357823.1 hypothetical protein [Chitinivibrionales bacterium]
MNNTAKKIGDLIEVPPVETVIRLDEARSDAPRVTSTFALTSDVSAHLHVISRALALPTGKGYFLQGDFGSGKSHFLAAVSAWLAGMGTPSSTSHTPKGLAELAASGKRFVVATVSLVNYRSSTSLERILAEAMEQALRDHGIEAVLSPLTMFRSRFEEIISERDLAQSFEKATDGKSMDLAAWFSRAPGEAYASCTRFLKREGVALPESLVDDRQTVFERAVTLAKECGLDGVVLMIDELSEFFRSKPDASQLNEDARTLQLVGELANRHPLWIVAAVQESIERTGDIASATFRKIKDRFPVKFMLSRLHIRELIAMRLVKKKPGADEHIYHIYDDYRKNFSSFTCEWNEYRDIYPIHPSTLALLEGLGPLFSQHRGIVDFVHARLAGDPSRHIEGALGRPAAELVAPDRIYEHFEPRLFEFSSFNIYPRHVVPHLDEVIDATIDEPEDRVLAKRLVRMLVLYAIHPTATTPNARDLAELSGCMLFSPDSDAAALFVAGGLLDPLVDQSPYLTKDMTDTDPLHAVYRVSTEEDSGKVLRARIRKTMEEIKPTDSRRVLIPLRELEASAAWPGSAFFDEPSDRTFTWRLTTRRASIGFVSGDSDNSMTNSINTLVREAHGDCGVLVCFGPPPRVPSHTAVWRIGVPGPNQELLSEYLAVRMVRDSLSSSNPAEAPLIPLADDAIRRLKPSAHEAVLDTVYAGFFTDKNMTVEPAVLKMQRFDRLVEIAGTFLLEKRFPNFAQIAPKLLPPSPRIYENLHEGFVVPGAVKLGDARSRGITDALDSIASPLGLVEVRSGTYRLSPNPESHRFLAYLFELLSPVGPTPLHELIRALRTGPYGVPEDMTCFTLAALAHSGLLSLTSGKRALPIEFIRPQTVVRADAVAPGELLSQADREFLIAECPFLAPPAGFGAFGLRLQRDVWQTVQKRKRQLENLIPEIEARIRAAGDFSAFDTFDFDSVRGLLRILTELVDEIKISYGAREGLERFLAAWRRLGLSAEDLQRVSRLNRFLSRHAEQFVFISHYLRSRSVENAQACNQEVAEEYHRTMEYLADPRVGVVHDEGAGLSTAFDRFREIYARYYEGEHRRYHKEFEAPTLTKHEQRGVEKLRKLSSIRCLDRPPSLEKLLALVDGGNSRACRRKVPEELLRSPVCACGFIVGDRPDHPSIENPGASIEKCLRGYFAILSAPTVLEGLAARAYALRDTGPDAAKGLKRLADYLTGEEPASLNRLMDMLDNQSIEELDRALSNTTVVEDRSLPTLTSRLSGRRLPPSKVRAELESWLGRAPEDAVLSIGGAPGVREEPRIDDTGWWGLLHPDLRGTAAIDEWRPRPDIEQALESRFPSVKIRERLDTLDADRIARFLANEPVHTKAMGEAWRLLTERVLLRRANCSIPSESSHVYPDQAALWARRLKALRSVIELDRAEAPRYLALRVHCAWILHDPLATDNIRRLAMRRIQETAERAEDWLCSLDSVEPFEDTESLLLVIVDAMAPDIWLECAEVLRRETPGYATQWHRLEGDPMTVSALRNMFAVAPDHDPTDALAERGIAYHTLSGMEQQPAHEIIGDLPPHEGIVVRFTLLDRAVHTGEARLCDLPARTARLFTEHIPGLVAACRHAERSCILTSDHGLTLERDGLVHGKGGVFERAIVRARW